MTGIITFNSTDEADTAVAVHALCKDVGQVLRAHYPHRNWYVEAGMRTGIIVIKSPDLTLEYGYVVHIHDKTPDQLRKAIVHAGGQVLEMFNMSRDRDASGGAESLERDGRGEVIKAATGL